jgi:hypothetical protein
MSEWPQGSTFKNKKSLFRYYATLITLADAGPSVLEEKDKA